MTIQRIANPIRFSSLLRKKRQAGDFKPIYFQQPGSDTILITNERSQRLGRNGLRALKALGITAFSVGFGVVGFGLFGIPGAIGGAVIGPLVFFKEPKGLPKSPPQPRHIRSDDAQEHMLLYAPPVEDHRI